MDLNKIIIEEINSLLNESYVVKDDKFKFKQVVQNVSFQNYEGFTGEYDSQITESNILINWNLSFWLNESGVENLIIGVDSVDGQYSLRLLNKHSDAVEQETQKDISETQWKYVVNNANIENNGSLYVMSLTFDFKNGQCVVTF